MPKISLSVSKNITNPKDFIISILLYNISAFTLYHLYANLSARLNDSFLLAWILCVDIWVNKKSKNVY